MMYFQQLYRTNKFWFLFVLIFALCQLFINYKQGIAITPLYHYGMYSKKAKTTDTIELYRVKINGKILQPFHFSAQEWDKLMLPVNEYCNVEKYNNDLFSNDIKRILNKIYLNADSSNFIVQSQPESFLIWYKKYASNIISAPINNLEIDKTTSYLTKENSAIKFTTVATKSFNEACK
jgi:hypothetical protein